MAHPRQLDEFAAGDFCRHLAHLAGRRDHVVCAGNVVTVEPGVYLPGVLGGRIEDLVGVGEDGCDVLTGLPRELAVVS